MIKKLLFFLFTMFVSMNMMAVNETADFSKQGYDNAEAITSYVGENFSIAFSKGTNNNAPKYYNTGTAIRCYGGNTITFSSNDTITEISFTFGSGDGTNAITSNVGIFSDGIWVGKSKTIVFTISGTSGHRRIKSVEVTIGEEPKPYTPLDTITCDSARIAAFTGKTDSILVKGYVTEIATAWNSQYNNISFWIADIEDGGKVFEGFRVACATEEEAPNVGDLVWIKGKLTTFNDTIPELTAGGTFGILQRKPSTPTDIFQVSTTNKPSKVFENQQVIIKIDDKIYNVFGQRLR